MSGDPATLAQIARALAAVHDCDGAGLKVTTPRWARHCPPDASDFEQRVWRLVHDLATDAGPPTALVHLDFHPANTLWYRGRLSGIIDWENGARGWPAEDLAKCRAYLTITHDRRVADELRAAYEAEIGAAVPFLALAEMAYGIGLQRQADLRAFALRQSGFPTMTEHHVRSRLQQFVEGARRVAG
ncbi:MAG: aminoglycoside phosphotransferase family protein [Acidimicrobiales bacterium]